ncbi:hypothetical protein [Micromonospora sp. U21]|uniref:hypothetical protein n=1 Tax=Micromonospora sp. U21 TaxID=2824899 RepID=UPI001FFCCC57|nr:hypothetical protein [Micromonospora sp. U21]
MLVAYPDGQGGAAIGVVSGGYSGSLTTAESYVPQKPVSVITFIGGQDRYASIFQRACGRGSSGSPAGRARRRPGCRG